MPASIDFTLTPYGVEMPPIPLRLYADGALYSPMHRTLFISDPHFGKADSFRHVGIAIPANIIDHDLAKISKLIAHSGAARIVVLGDFFHTRHSQSENVLTALTKWRSHHASLAVSIVEGNHDLHAGPPPAELKIESINAPFSFPPFICHHMPQTEMNSDGYILAGHLHPYVVMRDRDGSRLRFASFIFGPHQAILPAFGGFTGGSAYAPNSGDRVFVSAHGEIVEVPTTSPQRVKRSR